MTPSDTTRFTVRPSKYSPPAETSAPSDSLLAERTVPSGTSPLKTGSILPTTAFSSVMAADASACVAPTKAGSVMGWRPWETMTLTVLSWGTRLPAFGSVPMTSPSAMVALKAPAGSGTRPSSVSLDEAASGEADTKSGTMTSDPGPDPKYQPVPPKATAMTMTRANSQKPRRLRLSAFLVKRSPLSGGPIGPVPTG